MSTRAVALQCQRSRSAMGCLAKHPDLTLVLAGPATSAVQQQQQQRSVA
jgi:hypothetical protein